MERVLEGIMERYGTELFWLHNGVEEALRGFFQPVTSRSWQKLLRQVTPLGEATTGLYVYIGAASRELMPGDGLRVGQRQYSIRKTELIYDHAGPAYLWALCVRKGETEWQR